MSNQDPLAGLTAVIMVQFDLLLPWSGPRCEALLVAAKRGALVAQQRQRLARDAALDAPDAVRDLKVRTVLRRLEAATEAWQQAVDRVVEVVGGGVG